MEVSFVHDVAIPVMTHAEDIARKSGCIVRCAVATFKIYGMELNFKPGKSEGIIGFFGPGSRIARAALARESMQTPFDAGDDCLFRFVKAYQHVGTSIAVDLTMCEEVTKRCGMMCTEARNLSKSVLRCPYIPLHKKVTVMQTYILSKGTFQCGAWPGLPDVQYKRFHKCILDIYRSACGNYYKKLGDNETFDVAAMFSDDDLIFQYGFINPRTMLRLAKLSLFSRIVSKQPPALLDLIVAQSSFQKGWAQSLMGDLKWVSVSLDLPSPLPSTIVDWLNIVRPDPRCFSRKEARFCKSPFANICTQWAIGPVLQAFAQPIPCGLCNVVSKSHQTHALHMFRMHGIKSALRRYVPCTHCLVCLREFHTRENCLNHVRYRSKVCCNNLLLRGPSLSIAEASALDDACKTHNRELHAAGKRRHIVNQPSFYLSGPLLPILLAPGQYSAHHPLGVGHRFT